MAKSDWKAGSPWRLVFPDGRRRRRPARSSRAIRRERLVIRWRNEFKPELKAEGFSRCT